jgi:hypothetical protein
MGASRPRVDLESGKFHNLWFYNLIPDLHFDNRLFVKEEEFL